VRRKIVVRRGKDDGPVDFEQCLLILIAFLDTAVLHRIRGVQGNNRSASLKPECQISDC
jgi:hypothetical protein